MANTAILLALLTLVALIFYRYWQRNSAGYPFPPGPPADPLVGHLRKMPYQYQCKTFADWGKTYGDLIYTHVFGNSILILNSVEDGKELMEKRGSIYSDRPRTVLISELMGFGHATTFLHYGDEFRSHRKLATQFFNAQAVKAFRPQQKRNIFPMLKGLLDSPGRFRHHLARSASAAMTLVTYGHQVTSDDDPYVDLIERAVAMIGGSGTPGGTPVDIFPILRYWPSWMPGAGFKRRAEEARLVIRDMLDRPFDMAKRNFKAAEKLQSCLVSRFLEDCEQRDVTDLRLEEDMKNLSGTLYPAAVDTTSSVLWTFMLAMVLHPEVVKAAQEEIDSVVGRDRLPGWSDMDALPYVSCILKETLRWNPPVPLGVPRRVMQADIYQDKYIPRGTTIIPNIWGMLNDERLYTDPSIFNPERFLQESGAPEVYDSTPAVFGFGRRLCPGKHFAEAGIWLTIACVLATFDIKPPKDKDGHLVIPEARFTSGFTSEPLPFDCDIAPRDERAVQLIKQSVELYD